MAADLVDGLMWLVPVMLGEITLALSMTWKTGLRGQQGGRHAWQEIPRVDSNRLEASAYGAGLSDSVEAGAFNMRWRALCKWVHSSQIRRDCNVWMGWPGASDCRLIICDDCHET